MNGSGCPLIHYPLICLCKSKSVCVRMKRKKKKKIQTIENVSYLHGSQNILCKSVTCYWLLIRTGSQTNELHCWFKNQVL